MDTSTPTSSDRGELTQDQAVERLLARERAGTEPPAKNLSELADERDYDEAPGGLRGEVLEDEGLGDPGDGELEGDEFAEDDGGEDEAQKPSGADPVIKFDDGTSLPLSEVKRGFLRQQDYTRKTQEVAAERRNLEGERSRYLAERKQVVDRLTPLIQQAEAIVNNPDMHRELADLRIQDPGAYAAKLMDMQAKQAQVRALQEEQWRIQQAQQAEEQQRMAQDRSERIAASRKALTETIPAFKKDFNAEYAKLGKYILEQGISAEAWDETIDHPVVTLAWKAMQYDNATRKSSKTNEQLRKAPQPMRPGAARPQGYAQGRAVREAAERVAKSGSMDDAVALELARMRSRRR